MVHTRRKCRRYKHIHTSLSYYGCRLFSECDKFSELFCTLLTSFTYILIHLTYLLANIPLFIVLKCQKVSFAVGHALKFGNY